MTKRGFKIVSKYQDDDVSLPYRSTKQAAGYDLKSAVDILIPANYGPVLVPTGIKAYMDEHEYLMIVNRSSNSLKRHLVLANGIGIVDADYYNNPDNEGELSIQLMNIGVNDYRIKKGDRIAQGIFMPYLIADTGNDQGVKRTGGFGSTGR